MLIFWYKTWKQVANFRNFNSSNDKCQNQVCCVISGMILNFVDLFYLCKLHSVRHKYTNNNNTPNNQNTTNTLGKRFRQQFVDQWRKAQGVQDISRRDYSILDQGELKVSQLNLGLFSLQTDTDCFTTSWLRFNAGLRLTQRPLFDTADINVQKQQCHKFLNIFVRLISSDFLPWKSEIVVPVIWPRHQTMNSQQRLAVASTWRLFCTKGSKLCQENTTNSNLKCWLGRTNPCFHVVYSELLCYHIIRLLCSSFLLVYFIVDGVAAIGTHHLDAASVLCIYCFCNNTNLPLAGSIKFILLYSILLWPYQPNTAGETVSPPSSNFNVIWCRENPSRWVNINRLYTENMFEK